MTGCGECDMLLKRSQPRQEQRGIGAMESNPIMTTDEVSVYLNLHPLTVRRLARDGEIPAMKIGRQWRFKRDLLDRWLEEQSLKNVVAPLDTEMESE